MKPPLLLIGQGSHDDNGSVEFGRFVHRLRCRLDRTAADVSGGYLTRATPRLGDSIASLVARGHHRMVALPLSLSGETWIGAEISAAMALEQQRHPTLTCDYGRPLGADPRVLALLAERLADAAAEVPSLRLVPAAGGLLEEEPERIGTAETAVVLVGDGSTLPAANADVHRVSRLFWETHAHEYMTVETAFASLTPPGVPGGIERCRRLGARRVIVVPYLLFAGSLLDKVWAQAMAYAAGHPELDVRCADVIGDCEGLADVVIERYEEALAAAR
ncbi:cobalamin biosynthesis protein CbiX [Planobispora rosea]|uniref:Cobalamin biosynthesis protein CbiX n=1 Tax=Planobispora rosea TaxID=35762 RepID=A0A8J3S4L9_PLARO|nr:sirohydrochlorin chelatase [Planobispora rosea]GGS91968.1 cobalamin biosynthesis protein CbiX [Planobispora rosea]GIH87083.1 cobalamin biosynthesis protein CbiX [Planobispora rosea]